MGRRINISTPTVINTELVPLDESFYLEYDGQLEQWYYDNTEQYAPNRKVTPLLLSPRISAFDKDTATSYSPTFATTTQWYAKEWDEQQQKYVETLITNNVDSASADYVIQGDNLLVKKNVSYSHAVSIRCLATYIDPRDSGVTYTVEDSVNLTTNRTADVVFPEVDIISPSGRSYNPLVDDENSQYDFLGVKTNNPVQPLNTDVRRYSIDVDGTEEILNSGEAVAPIMDIRYGENRMTDQEFMYRQTAGGELVGESIYKAYIERIKGNTVAWNQGVFMLYAQAEVYGITREIRGNALHYSGTCTKITNFTGVNVSVVPVDTHKYYLSAKGIPDTCGISVRNMIGVDSYVGTFSGKSFGVTIPEGVTIDADVYFACIDLTLIYGEGNEPTTPEQFEADYERWFGKPFTYEEYDGGSLRPVLMQSVKTTGFNQWDEIKEEGLWSSTNGKKADGPLFYRTKNYIPVLPQTNYYYKTPVSNTRMCFYDSNKNFLGSDNTINNRVFATPQRCAYITFFWQKNEGNICFNISNPSKNGTYEPYEEKVQGFDVTTIKGKLIDGSGESVTIFPDGMKKAGSVQDEIFVGDGVIKAVKRVGRRSYESGDESDTSVITDGSTTTFYALTTPETYILDPITDFVWYGIKDNQEVLADTLPWYVSGQERTNSPLTPCTENISMWCSDAR